MLRARRYDRVTNALSEEFGQPPAHFANEAEAFLAVLDHYHLSDDTLLVWIHTRTPGKQWTLSEWRHHCEEVDALRQKLGLPVVDQIESELQICARCHSSVLNRIDRTYFCVACGSPVVAL